MRLTALCICGTLLAFSNLSWTTADFGEGALLWNKGPGPCAVTLRPAGPCGQGQDEDTCPYQVNLPPLTIHLPKQLRELEKIVKEVQNLKDNVDQLRKMCADCTVSQNERESGRLREREHEMLKEGKEKHETERNWMKERDPERQKENDRDLRKEFGTDMVKEEKRTMEGEGDTDLENRGILEETERKKWETERERDKVVIKENEKGKTQRETEGIKEKDKIWQAKVQAGGGKEIIVGKVREKVIDKNKDRRKETVIKKEDDSKGDINGESEHLLENGKESKMTSDVKNKEKVETEENDHHLWQDKNETKREMEKRTQSEEDWGSERVKMSEDHGHTNKEKEQHKEVREKERKMERNNDKPKQTESIGKTEKGAEEERETGKEIKTEREKTVQSVQRDSDGELVSSKASERTDFVSPSPSLRSTLILAPRPDSDETITFTSPLPSMSSSNSHFITDTNSGDGHSSPTQTSTTPGTSSARLSSFTFISSTRANPSLNTGSDLTPGRQRTATVSQGTTTTASGLLTQSPSLSHRTTSSTAHLSPSQTTKRWSTTSKMTVRSRVTTQRPSQQTTSPDLESAFSTTSRPTTTTATTSPLASPGQKISSHNTGISSTTTSLRPGASSQGRVKPIPGRGPRPGQKHKPGIKPLPKSHQKSMPPPQKPTSHQKPLTTNKTNSDQRPKSDQDPVTVQEPESDEDPIFNQKSKNEQKPVRPLETRKPDQKLKPERKPKNELKKKSDQRSKSNHESIPVQEHEPVTELMAIFDQDPLPDKQPKFVQDSTPGQKVKPDHAHMPPYQKPKPSQKKPQMNQRPHPDQKSVTDPNLGQMPKLDQKHIHPQFPTGQKTKPDVKSKLDQGPAPDQEPKTDQKLKTTNPDQIPQLNPKSIPDQNAEQESNKKPKPSPPPRHWPPRRPRPKPGATPVLKPRPAVKPKPSPKTKTYFDSSPISRTTSDSIHNSQTDMPPTSSPVKKITDLNLSQGDTEFRNSAIKTITLGPKTSTSPFLEVGLLPHLHTLPKGFTTRPNSRIVSDPRPQTTSQPASIPRTTRPNKNTGDTLHPSIIPLTSPGSTTPNLAASPVADSDSSLQTKTILSIQETAPSQATKPDKMTIVSYGPNRNTSPQTISTLKPSLSSDFRSTTPAISSHEPPTPSSISDSTTPSARELRVKINQVAAFLNNSLGLSGRSQDRHLKSHPKDPEGSQGGSKANRTDRQLPTLISSKGTMAKRDCSDHMIRGETKSGIYLVTPDLRNRTFPVVCDMELHGGGWTLLQRRQDGSVRFNRTWAEYRSGFGELNGGEFWLGNDQIHLLTRARDVVLRVELEDFEGVTEYAEYGQFRVASERLRYRLTVGSYSGSAGDALRFSRRYDHNNRAFTTPDRDHDRYPSGNCGAYYSSGWWFDACMAANLNGKYYVGKYKGVRDGIFWGTWHNISTEYYPTSDRHSFKTVKMMIRPKGFAP